MSMVNKVWPPALGGRAANPALVSPLALAYMGDCVYDLYVRTRIMHQHDYTAHGLHVAASGLVRASAQAKASRRVLELLTQDELRVFKRGRNAHMGTVAKNASIADYRAATGLEAVIGYIYLRGDDDRLNTLMNAALGDALNDENKAEQSHNDGFLE